MATGSRNNKSQQIVSRVPLELIEELELLKEDGESTAGFVVASIKGEIKRRQRRKKADTSEDSSAWYPRARPRTSPFLFGWWPEAKLSIPTPGNSI